MSEKLIQAFILVGKAMRSILTEELHIDITRSVFIGKHIVRWQDADGNERSMTIPEFCEQFKDHLGPACPTSTQEAAMGGGPW